MPVLLGFALAFLAGTLLSVFVLIGSQGMNDRTPILPMILAWVPMLAIAHGLGASAGLIPIGMSRGWRAWRFAVCGFAAGGAVEGLLFPLTLRPVDTEEMRYVAIAVYPLTLLLPVIGGTVGLKRANTVSA